MEFRILGPLAVLREGTELELGGAKQRALLAILLLHANEAVSRDRLIDGIWGGELPAHPDRSLDTYISRLRRTLGPERVERGPGGYTLRVRDGELDLDRFEQLAGARRYADALALWRGPALADLLFEPFAARYAAQLEERRLIAIENRVECELTAGAGNELVAELEALVRDHPLRERLLGQLMVALYRSGRQTTALEAFGTARRRFAEELGLQPGPELYELERRILTHDPGLVVRPRRRPHTRRRAALRIAAVATVVAAGTVGVVVALRGEAPRGAKVATSSGHLFSFDVANRRRRTSVPLTAGSTALAAGFGALWAADPNGERVLRIDKQTGNVVDRIPVRAQPSAIAIGPGAVWVASAVGGIVTRIDPGTDRPTRSLQLGGANPSALAFAAGRLWVADQTDQSLVRIDATTGSIERSIHLDLAPTALVAGGGQIWAAGYNAAAVDEVDIASNQVVARLPVGEGPSALAYAEGSVWVANALNGTLTRIAAASATMLSTIPIGSGPAALTVADGSIWVANEFGGTVSVVDAHTGTARHSIAVPGRPTTLASDHSRVWVGSDPSEDAHRGGTLVLSGTSAPNSIDPAFLYFGSFQPTQLPRLVYDTLVTFDNEPGARGLRLVPDLALQLPEPTANGTAYRFKLRPNIRYSTGRTVAAVDFRRAFERLFRNESPGRGFYTGIVGAAECLREPISCDLSRGIVTDRAANTVTFHLTAPDPDFLFKLTEYAFGSPVPPGAAGCCTGPPPPGTGPYRFANADLDDLRLERNPWFREWSHAAQPDGRPDRIEWRHAASHRTEVRDIEAGNADWTLDFVPVASLRAILRTHPALLHVNPAYIVEYIPLNTRLPPFDSSSVRQALNYAIDRRVIARLYGGSIVATPLCQPLPPGMPGYVRYCPYTANADKSGTYNGPDLAHARRLVARSGRQGAHVTVWGSSIATAIPPALPAYVASVLRSLGFRVTLHMTDLTAVSDEERKSIQLTVDGDWLLDFPSAASFLPPFFSCNGDHNDTYYCDPRLDALMRRAARSEADDATQAAGLWAKADHAITDAAWWIPMVNIREVDLVSPRLRNYEFHPVWGFLADQAWVR